MPDITTASTFTKDTSGFRGLGATDKPRTFLFDGGTYGTVSLQYTDDNGDDVTVENGTIVSGPRSFIFEGNVDLKIVTTGSNNFNVTII